MHPLREAIFKSRNIETATHIATRALEVKEKIRILELRRGALTLECKVQEEAINKLYKRITIRLRGLQRQHLVDQIEYTVYKKWDPAVLAVIPDPKIILRGVEPALGFPSTLLQAKLALIG